MLQVFCINFSYMFWTGPMIWRTIQYTGLFTGSVPKLMLGWFVEWLVHPQQCYPIGSTSRPLSSMRKDFNNHMYLHHRIIGYWQIMYVYIYIFIEGISDGTVPADCPKTNDQLDRLHAKSKKYASALHFQAIPSMRSPKNTPPPPTFIHFK